MSDAQGLLLEVRELKKSFPGVLALKGVSLTLGKGEVISLIGENGAGKSTLMKILAGVQPSDSGDYFIDGKQVDFKNVREAMDLGIALIHQELNLASNLDLASNIFLGREPGKKGFIHEEKLHAEATRYLKRVGLDLPSDTIASKSIIAPLLVRFCTITLKTLLYLNYIYDYLPYEHLINRAHNLQHYCLCPLL